MFAVSCRKCARSPKKTRGKKPEKKTEVLEKRVSKAPDRYKPEDPKEPREHEDTDEKEHHPTETTSSEKDKKEPAKPAKPAKPEPTKPAKVMPPGAEPYVTSNKRRAWIVDLYEFLAGKVPDKTKNGKLPKYVIQLKKDFHRWRLPAFFVNEDGRFVNGSIDRDMSVVKAERDAFIKKHYPRFEKRFPRSVYAPHIQDTQEKKDTKKTLTLSPEEAKKKAHREKAS